MKETIFVPVDCLKPQTLCVGSIEGDRKIVYYNKKRVLDVIGLPGERKKDEN